jgi:hypothetical protein
MRPIGVMSSQVLNNVIGALGGAAVNYAFIDHFQEVARAHFIIRKLERHYGKDTVREAYERLSAEAAAAA